MDVLRVKSTVAEANQHYCLNIIFDYLYLNAFVISSIAGKQNMKLQNQFAPKCYKQKLYFK